MAVCTDLDASQHEHLVVCYAINYFIPGQDLSSFGMVGTVYFASFITKVLLFSTALITTLSALVFQIIDHNATHIFVVLHFTNISDMAQISNMDLVVTADGALKTLQSLADDNMLLQFQVNISNGKMVSPVLVTSNRGRMIACNATCEECPSTTSGTTSTPKPEDNITNRLGLSDGVVAGIAVGLFFAGFIFALIFVCGCFTFVKCCMGKESREVSSVKYQKHDDELEDLP